MIQLGGTHNSPFPLLLWLLLCFLFSISDFSFLVFCLFGLHVLKKKGKRNYNLSFTPRLLNITQHVFHIYKYPLHLQFCRIWSKDTLWLCLKKMDIKNNSKFCCGPLLTSSSSGFLFLVFFSFSVFIFLGLNSELKNNTQCYPRPPSFNLSQLSVSKRFCCCLLEMWGTCKPIKPPLFRTKLVLIFQRIFQ